ncbi:hypothetical protein Hanom_Chr17g01525451 [Helianthus anomalus]
MDASFYDLDISTPQTLHGDHTPVNLTEFNSYGSWEEASLVPSYAPPLSSSPQKDSASLSLQSLWMKQPPAGGNWYFLFLT